MESLLTICIPTFNRKDYLYKNLEHIARIIQSNNLESKINIQISDNCSPDGTLDMLHEIAQKYPLLNINIHAQKINKGYSYNLNFLVSNCRSKFILLCGDDDYIPEEFFLLSIKEIETNSNLSCIIPAFQQIDEEGKIQKGQGRDLNCKRTLFKAGEKTMIKNSYRAHQLSGLIFKQSTIENIDLFKIDNLYPQIFYIAKACLEGDVLHLPEFPIKVTQTTKKDWKYDKTGLINDIFANYRDLNLKPWLRFKAEKSIIHHQNWRVLRHKKNPFKQLIFSFKISKTPNISSVGRFLMPMYVMNVWSKIIIQILYNKIKRYKSAVDQNYNESFKISS